MKGLFFNRIFIHQSGMSLVELLIAVGLIGGVAVSLMQSRDVLNTNRRVLDQRLEEDNIYRSMHMIFNEKTACENTLARIGLNLDPSGTTGQEFTEIRDEDDNLVYTTGMIIGRGNGSPVRIEEMRISHFEETTATAPSDGPVFWNNTNQATVTVELERVSDLDLVDSGIATSGAQGSVTRRFQLIVERDGSGAITNCITDKDFFIDTICDQLTGTLDANNRCRSVSLSLAGDTPPVPIPSASPSDEIAIRVGNHARVDGVTKVADFVELGGTFFDTAPVSDFERGIRAKTASFIEGSLLGGVTEIPALPPLGVLSLTQTGNIHIPSGVSIGGGGAAPDGGLYVTGQAIVPRLKLFGMEELVNSSVGEAQHPAIASNPNYAASVGYVARRITNALTQFSGSGITEGEFQSVLADILSNSTAQAEGARALLRYVCNNTRVTGDSGTVYTGVFSIIAGVPTCRINFDHRFQNCSIDYVGGGAPYPYCAYIKAGNLHIDRSISSWDQLLLP